MLRVRLKTRKSLIEFLADSQGYCCPESFVADLLSEKNFDAADRLGVSERTIIAWKQKLKKNRLSQCPACEIIKQLT